MDAKDSNLAGAYGLGFVAGLRIYASTPWDRERRIRWLLGGGRAASVGRRALRGGQRGEEQEEGKLPGVSEASVTNSAQTLSTAPALHYIARRVAPPKSSSHQADQFHLPKGNLSLKFCPSFAASSSVI